MRQEKIKEGTVYYRGDSSYIEFFNHGKLDKQFNDTIKATLDKYGLKNRLSPVLELGGGGDFETLLQLVKNLYEHREYLSILFAPLTIFYRRLRSYIENYAPNKFWIKPFIYTSLDINFQYDENYEDIYLPKNLLLTLFNLSYEISDDLKKQFPFYENQATICVQNLEYNFSIKIVLPNNKDKLNRFRMTKHIENLSISPNTAYMLEVGNLFTIKRTQEKVKEIPPYFYLYMDNPKTYFFFVSYKTLYDRFKNGLQFPSGDL